jgi:hypothetical protein
LCPFKEFPLESWLYNGVKPPLMGFPSTLEKTIVEAALQSFKELKDVKISFEILNPHGVLVLGTGQPRLFSAP